MKPYIRWMIRRDMEEVLRIEQASFVLPWTEEDFLKIGRERTAITLVAEVDDTVVGFVSYELHNARLNLLNLAVAAGRRRQHIGTEIISRLLGKLSSNRRKCITVAVRETNLTAQLFLRSVGFRARRVARAFYADTSEDAYLLSYRLSESQSFAGML